MLLFPLVVMSIDVIMEGGNLTGQGQNVCFQQTQGSCTQNGSQATYSCAANTLGKPCQINGLNCNNAPSPVFCFGGLAFLPAGASMTLQVTQISGQGIFTFGVIGAAGFISMIPVIIAVAVLSGATIFGSGLNQESIHDVVIAAAIMGLWLFFSTLDGFINGQANSFFTQLNAGSNYLHLLPFGTIFYIVLSLVYMAGFTTYISYGGD